MRPGEEHVWARRCPAVVAGAALLLMAAACGSGTSSTDTEAPSLSPPEQVVEALFQSLADADYAATAGLVDEQQLALLTAIEGAAPAEVAAMLQQGLPEQVRSDFWEAFGASLPSMVEDTVERAAVGESEDVGDGFWAVEVTFSASDRPAKWIVRDTDGERRVDLLATFGPAFSPNLADWFEQIPPGETRELIRDAFARQRSSLELGLEHEPLGPLGEQARTGVADLLSAIGA